MNANEIFHSVVNRGTSHKQFIRHPNRYVAKLIVEMGKAPQLEVITWQTVNHVRQYHRQLVGSCWLHATIDMDTNVAGQHQYATTGRHFGKSSEPSVLSDLVERIEQIIHRSVYRNFY